MTYRAQLRSMMRANLNHNSVGLPRVISPRFMCALLSRSRRAESERRVFASLAPHSCGLSWLTFRGSHDLPVRSGITQQSGYLLFCWRQMKRRIEPKLRSFQTEFDLVARQIIPIPGSHAARRSFRVCFHSYTKSTGIGDGNYPIFVRDLSESCGVCVDELWRHSGNCSRGGEYPSVHHDA